MKTHHWDITVKAGTELYKLYKGKQWTDTANIAPVFFIFTHLFWRICQNKQKTRKISEVHFLQVLNFKLKHSLSAQERSHKDNLAYCQILNLFSPASISLEKLVSTHQPCQNQQFEKQSLYVVLIRMFLFTKKPPRLCIYVYIQCNLSFVWTIYELYFYFIWTRIIILNTKLCYFEC